MSDYRHHANSYVNHTLNSSPSKNAFSFPRAERFPTQLNGTTSPEPQQPPCLHANGFSYYKPSPSKRCTTSRYDQRVEYNVTHRPYDWKVRQEVERILGRIQRQNQLSRSKSRSSSPVRNSPQYGYGQKKGQKGSPMKHSSKLRNSRSRSPQRQRIGSPQKGTFYKQLRDLDHPSQNITITGYYPVGTEISPTGRYASSKIKNVVGAKFSASSSSRWQLERGRNDYLGPGYYNHFSEFGP